MRTLQDAIKRINANAYANGPRPFTSSGQGARILRRKVQVGMIGINVPTPVPLAFYSCGGWKGSPFGDHVRFPTAV
jgi:malonate-semialdehyde dehydrogenase (acetylating)/methylmalonate-semialdehyde dehydrogenase